MSPAEFKKLLDRYFRGECTSEEIAFIEQWYENIPSKLQNSTEDDAVLEDRLWKSIKPSRHFIPLHHYWKAAAAILVLLVAALPFMIKSSTHKSPTEPGLTLREMENHFIEQSNLSSIPQQVTLSDGSVITLEPESTIRYPREFEATSRIVQLTGEAFFDVKRNPAKPFVVYSDAIITKVLGTSFRIKAFDNNEKIVVSVKTGRVAVSKNTDSSGESVDDVILTPNQQMVFDRKAISVIKQVVPVPTIVSVDSSSYYNMQFDGMPVTQIFEALSEAYGIEIKYDKDILESCVLTTKMTEEGFYDRIDVICKAINAQYTDTDGIVVVRSAGCK